ncbi:tyrosine-type recombinase/integrase [Ferrovum myxofaciens]|uniref:tyrosine-type recombinase/integrase n=1 Tax=Ferrovum myxofaciens TaxID=416213 RepID=UPI00190FA43E|nr:tyrosine-type recombinase/integrase [Ferrovum myxofaciens]
MTPLPPNLPKFPPQQTPYIYSTGELQRLLDATSVLESIYARLQAPMFQTLILLLYGSGLRVSEALELTMHDVDLEQRIITVRDTKFRAYRVATHTGAPIPQRGGITLFERRKHQSFRHLRRMYPA